MRRSTEAYTLREDVEREERKSADEGFLRTEHRGILKIQSDSGELVVFLDGGNPPITFRETDPEAIGELVLAATVKSKEAAKSRHAPELDRASQDLSRAQKLLESLKSAKTPPPSSSQPPGSPGSAA